jgi:predicted phage baseplate assembly protein
MNNEFCDCCEGLEPITPIANANRPGLAALTYRVGTHATFLETMQARLSKNSQFPALANLKTRAANDPSIAFLDAWATVADVLTFYQERIANEGYLRTATERRSILELARLVGYTPRPGVAATVFPAFMMEIGYNIREAEVPSGTRIQSVPGPGEMPQFFETADKIAARTAWNEIKPRLTRPLVIDKNNALLVETVYLKGITTNLRAGDPLLLTFRFETTDVNPNYPEPEPVLRKVATIEPQAVENFTKVTLQPEPLDDKAFLTAFKNVVIKYGALKDFCIDENSQFATRLLLALGKIIEGPPIEEPSSEVAIRNSALALLERVLLYTENTGSAEEEKFKERKDLFLAVFNLKKYGVESIWLNRLIAELEKLVRTWYLGLKTIQGTSSTIPGTQRSLKQEILSWANWLQKLNESSPQQVLDWFFQWLARGQPINIAPNILGTNSELENQALTISEVIPNFDSLSEIVTPLSQSPSLPPANRFQLNRKVSETFASTSDLRPRLLETLDPRLDSTIYQTLASDDRVPALSLKNPEAMRVKSAPFGHNAPLRPVYTSNGGIEGYEEWPIAATSIKILISRPTAEISTIPVTISLRSNTGSVVNQSINLNPSSLPQTEPIDSNVVVIITTPSLNPSLSAVSSPTATLIFTFSFQRSEVRSERVFAFGVDPRPFVIIDRQKRWNVSPGQTIRDTLNERRVVITVNEVDDGNWSSISLLDESPDLVSDQNKKIVFLDAQYDQIQPGSWISIARPSGTKSYRVIDTQTVSKSDYGISGRVTQLTLDKDWLTESDRSLSDLRTVTIYAQSQGIELAEEPLTIEPICGNKIELGTIYEGLKAGRWLIVSGDRVDLPNTKASELVMLAGVQNNEPNPPGSQPYSTLTLSTKLAYVYKRDTFKIYGNVVKATHGETRTEVLGSGDGSQSFQQFLLRQPPLTYLAAPTPLGSADTLAVRVNDVLWHETDSLSELEPIDRLYTLKTDDNAMTTVIFGNGEHGSRLPTGIENIRAVYRNGIGKVGNVKAEQINLLATRPLGLKGVINPLPASGGADRETRDRARENAPLAVMALDRLVSVQDYTDFARTFAGIGKASAQKLTDGTRQIVHVTISGAEDIPIDASSDLYRNLKKAMRDFGDPNQPIRLAVRKLVLLLLAAKIRVLPDYRWEAVEPQIRAALLDTFGFDRRQLGQSVWLSDIIIIIQQVRGVAYVDVDLFNSVSEDDIRTSSITSGERKLLIDGTEVTIKFQQETNNLVVKLKGLSNEPPKNKVDANLAKIDPKTREIQPAQLAIFSPTVADTLILTELKL